MVLSKSLGAAALGLALAGGGVMAAPHTAKAAWWGPRVGFGIVLPPVVVGPPAYYPPYYPPPPVYYAPPPPVAYYAPPRHVWVPPHWRGGYWVPGHWA